MASVERGTEAGSAGWWHFRPVVTAVVVGAALGAMSLLADGVLRSRFLTIVGNLASPWAIPAYLVGLLTTSRRLGALAGGVVLMTGVATYYGVWVPRGYPVSFQVGAWTVAALLMGPIMGVCGAITARRRERPPLVAVAAPSAVVLAEAAFFITNRRIWLWNLAVHPHRLVDLSVLLALLAVGLILPFWLVRPRARLRVVYPVVLVAGGGGAWAFFAAYRLLVSLPNI